MFNIILMRQELKDKLEELVFFSVKNFEKNNLNPERIVLYTTCKIPNEILVFNYTQNRFYNQQYVIDKKTPIVVIPYYKKERHGEKGDYHIDVGAFLIGKSLKESAFIDF